MLVKDFSDQATGEMHVTLTSGWGITKGFVPDPLPPNWDWPTELWEVLLEAHKRLAKLDGIGEHLPSAELVLSPLQAREAQKSSRLEGTITDPQQQALFEADPDIAAPEDQRSKYREVRNYARALRESKQLRADLPISLRFSRRLHETLMTGVRGQEKSPGAFRKTQNVIGSPPRFVPPPPKRLPDVLRSFESYLHSDHSFDPLVEAFLVHYQFEAIHPFSDGNGRVGRLLLAILIEEWCELSDQWLYMSDYFDRNKDEYIDRLYAVSANGDWTGWIRFCLQGVVEQSKDTHLRCGHLIDTYKAFHDRVNESGGSVRLSKIVDTLFQSPVVIPSKLTDMLEVTYPTVRSDMDKLDELGILELLPDAKQITYFSPRILWIIHTEELPSRSNASNSTSAEMARRSESNQQ